MSRRTILVTGGAGFIGSALCRHLARSGETRVINLDKLTYAGTLMSLEGLDDSVHRFVRGEIADGALVGSLLREERVDAVMHLAAESHVDRSIDRPAAFIETNILGTYRLLDAVLGYWRGLNDERRNAFRFHHVSTDEVFGSLGDEGGCFTAETPYAPTSPYAASKAGSDHLVRAWFATYGLPTILSNCSNNYGPFHFPEKLIPLAILNAIEDRPIPVYGDGANVRDWLFVDDHARALDTIVTRGAPGETYLVGARAERRNIEVVEAICALLDARRPRRDGRRYREQIRFVGDRPGHDRRYAIDPSRLETELGWQAAETFESGLARTVDWFLDRSDWWQPLRTERYDGERLGLA